MCFVLFEKLIGKPEFVFGGKTWEEAVGIWLLARDIV